MLDNYLRLWPKWTCRSSLFSRRVLIAGVLLVSILFAIPLHATTEGKKIIPSVQREEINITAKDVMKPWIGDLDAMIERRVIRVLTVYSKTFYFVNKGHQQGIIPELLHIFEKDLNKTLAKEKKLRQKRLKVSVVFIPVSRGEMIPALVAGKGDIAASNLTITDGRLQLVDFSIPTYPSVSEVVVAGPESHQVKVLEDLAGKEVFVRKSSSYYESLVTLNERFLLENKPTVIIKEVPEELEDEDLIEMVNAGLIPLIVVDKHKAVFWKKIFPKITVHEEIVVRTGDDIAWAVRKGSPQLLAALNEFIPRHRKGTMIGNTIIKRYLSNTKYVQDVASEQEREKFFALTQYFKKYGKQYDVDWLLMMSQGYQESRLDHAVRSPVGAIGVMQIMPATGKDMNVGDIVEIDANIHAGVKYMRWLIDRYYQNEDMTKLDKILFGFASYNAGAGRVRKLRKETAERGMDPNIWFHNVEVLAAEKIGAETVTYVSNIYKYYVAYSLMLEAGVDRAQVRDKMKSERAVTQ